MVLHTLLIKKTITFRFDLKTYLKDVSVLYVTNHHSCTRTLAKVKTTACGNIYLLDNVKSIPSYLKVMLVLYCLKTFYIEFQKMTNYNIFINLTLLKIKHFNLISFYNFVTPQNVLNVG